MPNRAAGPRTHPGPSLPGSRQGQEARSAATPPLLAPKCPRPILWVCGGAEVCRPPTRQEGRTNRFLRSGLSATQPPHNQQAALLDAAAAQRLRSPPGCNGWPQLDRVFDADQMERSGRLATSSGLIGGAVSMQRSLSRFARSASGSTPTRCDALPRATHCWVAETTGTRFQNEYGLNPARSSEALPASLWGRFPATNGSQAGLCRQH